ncbi:MAG: YceI family protein [Planctomycetota bacterium]
MVKQTMAVGVLASALVGGAVVMGIPSGEPAVARASEGAFSVDPVHSMVVFGVGHLGVAKNYGRFNDISGTFNIDRSNIENAFIDITVQAESVDTANESRDKHLRSPDFFNTRQFPTLTFTSDEITAMSRDLPPSHLRATGELTMHGVTKDIEVEIHFIGEGQTPRGYKQGFEARFTIKRSDFGMTKYLEGNGIGDEVDLIVAIEGDRE